MSHDAKANGRRGYRIALLGLLGLAFTVAVGPANPPTTEPKPITLKQLYEQVPLNLWGDKPRTPEQVKKLQAWFDSHRDMMVDTIVLTEDPARDPRAMLQCTGQVGQTEALVIYATTVGIPPTRKGGSLGFEGRCLFFVDATDTRIHVLYAMYVGRC
jgi:hypothetical protein